MDGAFESANVGSLVSNLTSSSGEIQLHEDDEGEGLDEKRDDESEPIPSPPPSSPQ